MSDYSTRLENLLDAKGKIRDVLNKNGHFNAEYNVLLLNLEEDIQALIAREAAEARLKERNMVALDNYSGHTFSDSTNYKGKFEKFIRNNEVCIAELQQTIEGSNNEQNQT